MQVLSRGLRFALLVVFLLEGCNASDEEDDVAADDGGAADAGAGDGGGDASSTGIRWPVED